MEPSLRRVVDAFAGLRVLVVGDAILDRYLRGRSTRLSREAPVPVVDLDERHDAPGGAANAAVNLAGLGAQVQLLAVVGADPEGAALLDATRAAGVDVSPVVRSPRRTTSAKHRLAAGTQLLLRFDQGSAHPLDDADERSVVERLVALLPLADAVLVSDYELGIRTPQVLNALAARPVSVRVCMVDARSPAAWRAVAPTAVKPNFEEAAHLLGLPLDGPAAARPALAALHGGRMLEMTGARIAAITLDSDGAVVLERNAPAYQTYATKAETARPNGCGDTYSATLTLALAAGATTVAAAELRADDSGVIKMIPTAAVLTGVVRNHRLAGRRIVFTNGVFDLLHRGHVTYLSRAKALGDILVVAVNDDLSVRAIKGPLRPLTPLEDRMEVLAALSCVDHVVSFSEHSPRQLLRAVRPDVYVKGGDYTRETLPETALVESMGGTVTLLEYLDGRSTTKIINRIPDDPDGLRVEHGIGDVRVELGRDVAALDDPSVAP